MPSSSWRRVAWLYLSATPSTCKEGSYNVTAIDKLYTHLAFFRTTTSEGQSGTGDGARSQSRHTCLTIKGALCPGSRSYASQGASWPSQSGRFTLGPR
ncbi:hypothetical protein BD626DRAFT_20153 [Schizophyllum amplum]|uniref:Uncharacterized protein n=1 Tax=Schizophyllum amplum TaxID=97359 RepID=A0A550CYN7_9AGAR|nr:hypothetical protein BD626DRAFT_20153 [Auriculariopsis ampla]